MGMDATDLQRQRDAMMGNEKAGVKTENVVKMFGDPDKIRAIKASTVTVIVGNPPTELVIRPLNPKLGVEAYSVLRTTMLPIVNLYRKQVAGDVTIVDVFDAFGENVAKIPHLIFLILSRGNPQITEEWVDNNLDLVPDLMTILPHFMAQNMFDTLFSPKARAPLAPPPTQSESATQEVMAGENQKAPLTAV